MYSTVKKLAYYIYDGAPSSRVGWKTIGFDILFRFIIS